LEERPLGLIYRKGTIRFYTPTRVISSCNVEIMHFTAFLDHTGQLGPNDMPRLICPKY
jgi:hypothetical protein